MADLTSKYPGLSLHLVDPGFTPLITSTRTQQQLQSLSTLSQTALLVQEAAQRLGLGTPQRVMVEHAANGPVLLHSFLSSTTAKEAPQRQLTALAIIDDDGDRRTTSPAQAPEETEDSSPDAPPILLATVVAPSADSALEARRAASRLEKLGRTVQTRWIETQQTGSTPS